MADEARAGFALFFPRGNKDGIFASLSVQARPQGSELLLTLQTRGVGHAMPSGDPFRSLELEACADPDCQQVLHRVALGRRLQRTPTGWVDHEDSRIPPPQGRAPAQRTVTLPAQGVVAWRLSYRLVDARHEALLPPEEARLLLHQGLLP